MEDIEVHMYGLAASAADSLEKYSCTQAARDGYIDRTKFVS